VKLAEASVARTAFAQPWHSADPAFVACLHDVTAAIPEDGQTFLTRFNLTGEMRGEFSGKSTNGDHVFALLDRLRASGRFADVKQTLFDTPRAVSGSARPVPPPQGPPQPPPQAPPARAAARRGAAPAGRGAADRPAAGRRCRRASCRVRPAPRARPVRPAVRSSWDSRLPAWTPAAAAGRPRPGRPRRAPAGRRAVPARNRPVRRRCQAAHPPGRHRVRRRVHLAAGLPPAGAGGGEGEVTFTMTFNYVPRE
jgi:hypothetical protein